MEQLWAPWRMSYVSSINQESSQCIFCLAAQTGRSSEKLVLDVSEHTVVLMNRFPYTNGHLMVAPRLHTADMDVLTDDIWLEMMSAVRRCRRLLEEYARPHGFNIGINLGKCAGAGIDDHLHIHIVPRWNSDSNFMTVTGNTRVIPEELQTTYLRLLTLMDQGL